MTKFVLSWLNDIVAVGDDVDALAVVMTQLGMPVEEIVTSGAPVAGVVTARVLRTERHPDAAKVHRVWVDAGDGVERHVWCGAFNMNAGDVVPLAQAGTAMPDGRVIEARPILGIPSMGMLCSARELGLGDDHTGILILPPDAPLGVPYTEALELGHDVVFDIDLTRNRPDCWGHLGVARDVGARLGAGAPNTVRSLVANGRHRTAPVELVDGQRCSRFTTVVLSGIDVKPSPDWIAQRLSAAGMRPINNVVDASNYVMLEVNQPNHAYDLDTLGGGGFRVRLATEGERMTTLDGVERAMSGDDLLICDANDVPIGIGGVMGGLDSEITDATTVVALEIAYFEPTAITRTMNRLGIRSEASGRFERGVDPYGMPVAQARFCELLAETCPQLVIHDGAVDARHDALPPEVRTTDVRVSRVNRLLGTSLDAETIRSLIAPIGFHSEWQSGDVMTVQLPSWRPDSIVEVDVIEEIARHYGYHNLAPTVPKSTVHGRLSPLQARRRQLRQVLLGHGLDEVITETMLHAEDLASAQLPRDAIHVTNPLVADEDVLRPTMRPGLLRAIRFNESHRRPGVAFFEIGHLYPIGDRSSELPPEYEALAVATAGAEAPEAVALWREIAASMGLGARLDQSNVPPGLHPSRSATLSLGRDVVGAVGEIHPDVLEAFGVAERVAWLELDLTRLLTPDPKVPQWKPISRYPSTDVDLAFVVPETTTAEKIDKAIRQAAAGLLVDLALFDVFRGAGLPDDSRSLAYRLRLQAHDRTLTDTDVADLVAKVVKVTEKLGATLRR
jgi:phenylalanyl-tRNA synthetase beta chain